MSTTDRALEIISTGPTTAHELAQQLNVPLREASWTASRLYKEGRVDRMRRARPGAGALYGPLGSNIYEQQLYGQIIAEISPSDTMLSVTRIARQIHATRCNVRIACEKLADSGAIVKATVGDLTFYGRDNGCTLPSARGGARQKPETRAAPRMKEAPPRASGAGGAIRYGGYIGPTVSSHAPWLDMRDWAEPNGYRNRQAMREEGLV